MSTSTNKDLDEAKKQFVPQFFAVKVIFKALHYFYLKLRF